MNARKAVLADMRRQYLSPFWSSDRKRRVGKKQCSPLAHTQRSSGNCVGQHACSSVEREAGSDTNNSAGDATVAARRSQQSAMNEERSDIVFSSSLSTISVDNPVYKMRVFRAGRYQHG